MALDITAVYSVDEDERCWSIYKFRQTIYPVTGTYMHAMPKTIDEWVERTNTRITTV